MAVASTTSPAQIVGPAWDLSDEYPSLTSKELEADLNSAIGMVDEMKTLGEPLANLLPGAREISLETVKKEKVLDRLAKITQLRWAASTLLRNVGTFANCIASVDGTDAVAKKTSAKVAEMAAQLSQAAQPASLFLDACPEDVAEAFLLFDKETAENEFIVKHSRKMRDHALSLPEENMLASYNVPGLSAWGTLYTDLSGSIAVTIQEGSTEKKTGLAAAASLLDSNDEETRKKAWWAIKDAWQPHAETCAAILNAITAWRLETYKRRQLDGFFKTPLHQNRMSRKTLDALFEAIDESADVGRRAMKVQAAALGKPLLEPWDLFAPAPVADPSAAAVYTFDEGIEVIAKAVGEIDAKAGDFVRMMRDNKWIEATAGDNKRPGAYCTGFPKSRNPRVYLSSYNGRAPLLLTLAHELGHAYHSWLMRDLPLPQKGYPMNLAETASIFFETVVAADLLNRAKSTEEKFAIAWNNADSAATFLLNIPARFKFERDLNERRPDGKLSTEEIDAMMVDAWRHYYGDALAQVDIVGGFSMSKLHFYLSGLSFYNFPYTFGLLFSLGVYAERERVGPASFSEMYRALLCDTGRMSAEDVVLKHLGGRIDETAFWQSAIGIVRGQVEAFESLAKELGYLE